MKLYIVVSNAAGTIIGQPIVTALSWENTPRLSRAGKFRFSMPATDPRAANLAPERRVTCYTRVGGVYTEVGAGVVKRIQLRVDNRKPFLDVSGDDLLIELTYYHVQGLTVYDDTSYTPVVLHYDAGVYTTLTNATDGNPATFDTIGLNDVDSFLYIGYASTFNIASFDLGTLVNANTGEPHWGFSDDQGGWEEPIVTDGTIASGKYMTQSGDVTFIRPSNWTQRTINGLTRYWLRLDPDSASSAIDINEVTITSRTPSTSDLTDILAFAPGWSLDTVDWYGSTTNGTMQTFGDETVLAALVKTAERTGEAFRLGEGRQVEWLRKDRPDSGLRAMRGGDPIAIQDNPLVCLIVNLAKEEDSSQLATRVYPFGAGNSTARVTIADRTTSVPAGYTVGVSSAGRYYIKSNAGETAYSVIEAVKQWKEIAPPDGSGVRDTAASNELFTAALEWLMRHEAPFESLTLTVTKVDQILKPGETIEVNYREVIITADGPYIVEDIRADYLILEPTTRIDPKGMRTVGLKVANLDRWPETDDDTLAKVVEQGNAYQASPQPISSAIVR